MENNGIIKASPPSNRGRPKRVVHASAKVEVSMTEAQKAMIRCAANHTGLSMSAFLLSTGLRAAREECQEA